MGEEMNKSIWSKGYWKGAAKRFSSVRMLAVCAMLLALRIAVGSVFIPLGDSSLRIYFTFFIIALGASVYGPLMAVVAGCAADLLSFAIAPSGPFFPGYTLSSMLGGLIYGLFLYRRDLSVVRVFLCKLTINVLVNMLLGSLWNSVMMGKAFYYYLAKSVVKNLVLLPLETALMVLIFRLMNPLLIHLRLIPENSSRHIPFLTKKNK